MPLKARESANNDSLCSACDSQLLDQLTLANITTGSISADPVSAETFK